MVYIWTRSETFAHGFLIVPISLWLIWTQRELLGEIVPEPAGWVNLLLLPLGMGWLLAWLVDVSVVQQLALVAMLIVGAWAIMGHRLAGILAFPLFFLFFAVPMGESLVDPMMEFTASSTIWLIKMTGIPVYREGLNFTLPTGSWSVVEACSGVRYIIASVTVGVLYAYLTYRSWVRRLLFILVSAIVPVFANTARAYIIVMLGHMSDMTIATGADHLVYGWVFFGLVIFLLFWLGSFFREDDHPLPVRSASTLPQPATPPSARRILLVAVSSLLIALVAPLVAHTIVTGESLQNRQQVALPGEEGAWSRSKAALWGWTPPAKVSGQHSAFYRRSPQEDVGLTVQFADGTIEKADVVGSDALFTRQGDDWIVVSQDKLDLRLQGIGVAVEQALLRRAEVELLVWSWYLIGDLSTSNDYLAKAQQVLMRLGLVEAGAFRIVLFTPVHSSLEQTQALLLEFVDDYMPTVYQELRQKKETVH